MCRSLNFLFFVLNVGSAGVESSGLKSKSSSVSVGKDSGISGSISSWDDTQTCS